MASARSVGFHQRVDRKCSIRGPSEFPVPVGLDRFGGTEKARKHKAFALRALISLPKPLIAMSRRFGAVFALIARIMSPSLRSQDY